MLTLLGAACLLYYAAGLLGMEAYLIAQGIAKTL